MPEYVSNYHTDNQALLCMIHDLLHGCISQDKLGYAVVTTPKS